MIETTGTAKKSKRLRVDSSIVPERSIMFSPEEDSQDSKPQHPQPRQTHDRKGTLILFIPVH